MGVSSSRAFFFFNDTATTEIYTLSLHDALPIYPGTALLQRQRDERESAHPGPHHAAQYQRVPEPERHRRSEEHTSELQSQSNLVCRLLLEKKKNNRHNQRNSSTHFT